jgi:hypothetical protein
MAIGIGTILGIGGSLLGGMLGAKGSKDAAAAAAKGQEEAARINAEEQRRQFDFIQMQQSPFRQYGLMGLSQYAAELGLDPRQFAPAPAMQMGGYGQQVPAGTRTVSPTGQARSNLPPWLQAAQEESGLTGILGRTAGFVQDAAQSTQAAQYSPYDDMTRYYPSSVQGPPSVDTFQLSQDPGYQFRLQQGEESINRANAASGGFFSGGRMMGLTDFSQGLASQEYGAAYARKQAEYSDRMNRLASMAGIGQTATNTVSAAAQSMGQNIGAMGASAASQAAQYSAAGTMGAYQSWGNAASSIGGILGQYYQQQNQPSTTLV